MRFAAACLTSCLALAGCGAAATETPEGTSEDAARAPDTVVVAGKDLAASAPASPDGVEMRGVTSWRETAGDVREFAVALRWVIEYSDWPTPPERVTSRAHLDDRGGGELILRVNEAPPAEALGPTEATERAGVAVAYVEAFVDGNGNGLLDCYGQADCEDVPVGASPNAMVVYAEEGWPAEGAPLFGFNGAPGVRPAADWSLVHLQHNGPEARPTARDWTVADTIELVIVGDFRELERNEARSVHLDVD